MCNCHCLDAGFCVGNFSYVIERLAQCIALTAVVTCLMMTLMIMLGLGVGVGYNYCFVEHKLNKTLAAGLKMDKEDDESLSTGEEKPQVVEQQLTTAPGVYATLPRQRRSKEEADNTNTEETIKPTMIIPLHRIGLLSLITRLQKRNKNVTLELFSFNATKFY